MTRWRWSICARSEIRGLSFTFSLYVPHVGKTKDSDPLERWRHFEAKYAEQVAPLLGDTKDPSWDREQMIELASLRAKADRWRDRYFKALAGVSD